MEDAQAVEGCCSAEIPLFQQQTAEAPSGGFHRNHNAVNAPADDDEIIRLLAKLFRISNYLSHTLTIGGPLGLSLSHLPTNL